MSIKDIQKKIINIYNKKTECFEKLLSLDIELDDLIKELVKNNK